MSPLLPSPDRRHTGSLKWDRYAGHDIIPLWVADMDFVSAPPILDALRARLEHGVFGYTIPYPEVIDAVLDYHRTRHGLALQEEWLCWMPGLGPALNLACRATGEPGTAVMMQTPVYPPFLSAPLESQRTRNPVPLLLDEGVWKMDWPAMERAVTPETRLFILCNPHNPVGCVWPRDELERLLDFCERHDLTLVSDEIHCDLILDEVTHTPTLSLGQRAEHRTIALYAPSKTYNLPGLACAYAVIPDPKLRTAFRQECRGIINQLNAFGYAGCAAAYRHGEPWRQALLKTLRTNRDRVFRFVKDRLPGVVMHPMQATYLAWLDVRALGLDDPAAFFEDAGVGLSDGRFFGTPGWLRLNFGCPQERLEEALERMARALKTTKRS